MIGIFLSICIGVVIGLFFQTPALSTSSDSLIDLGLCLLLFFVGIDIGDNSSVFINLKTYGKKIWFLPFSTIIGSLLGGFLGSLFLPISVGEGLAISSGLGWYSLSAIELSKISAELGSVAFLSNVFREILAILTIPLIAKSIGSFESISTAGATAMDTLLPVINKSNSSDISVIAFFSGVVLTTSVPILVPLIVNIFNL
ncbi:lysine exporter LysO family protein [Cetobacterium somerae]|uniref:lysine exporter LysO family protein n=1 Tax=Cetobacterium sp. NK01 TaxID=2993530 RepID=UPI002116AB1E|nr:lysine exporter LysO family protein [Cetobacterium sp. NK01]MCQ8211414.1 lysine exporter LysO family protein [Cetobacterium sp. NK01]